RELYIEKFPPLVGSYIPWGDIFTAFNREQHEPPSRPDFCKFSFKACKIFSNCHNKEPQNKKILCRIKAETGKKCA
ncbi:MAG: hypothetical protein IIY58_03560, partial [Aeriscardovia sp.]|nr:hypothetical protein [Aeriscardovia sp.]